MLCGGFRRSNKKVTRNIHPSSARQLGLLASVNDITITKAFQKLEISQTKPMNFKVSSIYS
jgi:hypothetical protein